jgi:hypothetical protein
MNHDRNGKITRLPKHLSEELNWRLEKGILPRHGGAANVSCKMVKRPPSPVSSPPGEDKPWFARQHPKPPPPLPVWAVRVSAFCAFCASLQLIRHFRIRVHSRLKYFPKTPIIPNRLQDETISLVF